AFGRYPLRKFAPVPTILLNGAHFATNNRIDRLFPRQRGLERETPTLPRSEHTREEPIDEVLQEICRDRPPGGPGCWHREPRQAWLGRGDLRPNRQGLQEATLARGPARTDAASDRQGRPGHGQELDPP